MKSVTLFSLLFAVHFSILSQDYSSYYRLVNKAEEQFVTKRDNSCFALYDEAFASNKPFVKDPYIACQIAFYLGDTNRFYGYLRMCFSNGMPATAVDASPLLKTKLTAYSRMKIAQLAKLHCKIPEPDSSLYTTVRMKCYQLESLKMTMGRDSDKIQQLFALENELRALILDSLLEKGRFANEHLFPITCDARTEEFYKAYNLPTPSTPTTNKSEYELRVMCPYNMLLHSHCFFQEHKVLLLEMVKKGYLHPKEYGILEEASIILYRKDGNKDDQCEQPKEKICYNIIGHDAQRSMNCYTSKAEGLEMVEQNRKDIYMQRFSVDELKKKTEKELGIVFFFDFIDRQQDTDLH